MRSKTHDNALVALMIGVVASVALANPAMSGTLRGNVNAESGDPLSGVSVLLYKAQDTSWSYQGNQRTDEDGAFDFGEVSDGTYYVRTRPSDDAYIDEYYEDAYDFSDKTEVSIASDSDEVLNIVLGTKPVYVEDLEVFPDYLLSRGGEVEIYGTAVNDTGAALDIYFWVTLNAAYTSDNEGRSFTEYGEWTYLGPVPVVLPAGRTPFVLPISLPAESQSGLWYSADVFIARGHPSFPIFETRAGRFFKREPR